MDVVTAMSTAATTTATNATIFEPMERNKDRKWRRMFEHPGTAMAHSDWTSHMETKMRQ
jgi:hypothetical protein